MARMARERENEGEGEVRRVASVHSIGPAMREGIEARFPTEQASYK